MGGKLWHEGGNKSLRYLLGVRLDVGGIIFHQLCDGGRALWDWAVLGKVCHWKSHHNLLGSRACNPSPGNHCIGVPSLAIPSHNPILSNLRKWTLDPLLFYAFSVNSRTHGLPDPSQYSSCFCWAHSITSNGSNGTPAISTAWSSLPCRVVAQLWHCLHWTYYTEPYTKKNRGPVWDLRQRFMQCRNGPAHGPGLCLL